MQAASGQTHSEGALGCLSPSMILSALPETYIFLIADRAGADARSRHVKAGAPMQALQRGQSTLKLWDGQDP